MMYVPSRSGGRSSIAAVFVLISVLLLSNNNNHDDFFFFTNAMVVSTPPNNVEHNLDSLSPELEEWREYNELRGGLNYEKLTKFFSRRPYLITGRLIKVGTILKKTIDEWESAKPTESPDESADDGIYNFDYVSEDEMDRVNSESGETDRGKKLCERMSSLGPVAVKICQTLSQRADIVGDEACNALKTLQTANIQFDDDLAIAIMKESLNWNGPIAENLVNKEDGGGKKEKALFEYMSEKPIAVASLGQVYKARTHDGLDVAVKVQRPDGTALLSTDIVCFKLCLKVLDSYRKLQPGRSFDPGLLDCIVDRIATDITEELNYIKEAANGVKFAQSLSFLGFVKTPKVVTKYSTDRVLVTEWVKGDHLNKLPKEEGLAMTRMAVEACTASIVLTGYVHADPHEGNLMLDEDGNIVFLDFGLMSDVSEDIMEAFASGIQACLAEDWVELTKAFKSTGFICDPVEWKPNGLDSDEFVAVGLDPVTGEDLGIAKLSDELGEAMRTVEGGTSRFGALATVLNQYLSERWKMQTPPYVLLLIRTFLTLEGIAGRVDPDFNIYEMAMPWAVRRSLSPATKDGIATLRSTLLTKDNKIQWNRFVEMVEEATKPPPQEETATTKMENTTNSVTTANAIDQEDTISSNTQEDAKPSSTESAKKAAMNDAVVTLLGSPEGVVLRTLLNDLDSTDLVSRLLSKEGKSLRHQAVVALTAWSSEKRRKKREIAAAANNNDEAETANRRPVSKESAELRERQMKWTNKVKAILIRKHLKQQIQGGPLALIKLFYLTLRVVLGVIHHTFLNKLRRFKLKLFARKQDSSSSHPTEATAASL